MMVVWLEIVKVRNFFYFILLFNHTFLSSIGNNVCYINVQINKKYAFELRVVSVWFVVCPS